MSQNYEKIKDVHPFSPQKSRKPTWASCSKMSSVKAGNGPVNPNRLHLKFHCRFSALSMISACSLDVTVTSAPADAHSAMAATSWDCLGLTLCIDGQQA
ncbi:hypothetical protein [Peribacillus simplex]|uniref:hypothetical protein n=1 Tax=Peribacillus simplex TaxID=1478 RepID=UPI0024C1E930|nr:hypothetical protein [Peribacillus simplex]WHY56638.1 hypothetical protein QNH43_26720 [Peribacillus simplex]